jgi:hypothetical protein
MLRVKVYDFIPGVLEPVNAYSDDDADAVTSDGSPFQIRDAATKSA